MELEHFFALSLTGLGAACGIIFIVVCIGMLLHGVETGADRIKQYFIIKRLIYPLANALGGISLVFALLAGLGLLFSPDSDNTQPLGSTFGAGDLALYSLAIALFPLAALLIGAITQPILGQLSKGLMALSMYIFFTVPVGLVGLLISGIWWLIT